MEIKIQNTPFTSRAQIVKDCDRVCRIMKSEFDCFSSSKYIKFDSGQKLFQSGSSAFDNILNLIMKNKIKIAYSADPQNPLKYYETIIELIKKTHGANCKELARLCKAICRMNGIPAETAQLSKVNKKGYGLIPMDHMVCVVTPKKPFFRLFSEMKEAVIIDPWLGTADLAPAMGQRYKGEFLRFIGEIPDDNTFALFPDETNIHGMELTEEVLALLRQKFPQLLMK